MLLEEVAAEGEAEVGDEVAVEEAVVEEAAVEEERHEFEMLAERLGVRFEPPAHKDNYRIPRCGGSGSAEAAGNAAAEKAVAEDETAVDEEAAPLFVRLWKLRQAERSSNANAERHHGILQRLRRRRDEAPKLSRKLVQLAQAASVSCGHAAVR